MSKFSIDDWNNPNAQSIANFANYNACMEVIQPRITSPLNWNSERRQMFLRHADMTDTMNELQKILYDNLRIYFIIIIVIAHVLFLYTIVTVYREEKNVGEMLVV